MKKLMMMAVALSTFAITDSAEARDRQLSVHEVKSFMTRLNNAWNNPDIMVGRSFLKLNVAENASFNATIHHPWPHYASPYHVYEGRHYDPYYYRYPYYRSYKPVSIQNMTKWEMIGDFQSKKRSIPGYFVEMDVVRVDMPAAADSATVKLVKHEYSSNYAPHHPGHMERVRFAVSECIASLDQTRFGDITLEGMRCSVTDRYAF
jgi:hypothetical protein